MLCTPLVTMLFSATESIAIPKISVLTAIDLRTEYRSQPLGIDTLQPRLSWALNGSVGARNQRQSAYRIIVASTANLLQKNRGDLWDTAKVSSNKQQSIRYLGKRLKSDQTYFWKVKIWDESSATTWSRPTQWETGLLEPSDWVATWINDGKQNPTKDTDFYKNDPAPLFRKEFRTQPTVARARLFITGLGYYEAAINGVKVGDHVLDPGWTKFDKRTLYSVYDVTKQVLPGKKNCLGVILGNGWFNPLPLKLFGSFNLREKLAVGRPRLIAQLHIDYKDGTREIVASDRTWKVASGPIVRNDIYIGEVYDARKEQIGWDKPGFDDTTWTVPALATEKLGPLVAQAQPPIRVTTRWSSVKVTSPIPGVHIYDMGVNFAGWASLKLDQPPGTKITLRYGELLHADGSLNPMTSVAGQIKGFRQGTTESVGGPGAPEIAWQTDTYIARGGPETFTPKFTFHGFRYVEVTGLTVPLPLSAVIGIRLNSDVEDAGKFECSVPLLNEIQAMCRRTFKSNIFSVQSDCPHRERLSYGGDIVATSEALMGNFDMATFYNKAVKDWSDSALPNGMMTDTAPYMGINYCGLVWAMAHPLLIDQLSRVYGMDQAGTKEYEAAKTWMKLVEQQYPDGIVTDGLSDHEGLAPTPAPELVTPLYFQCANLLSAQAARLNIRDDEAHFLRLAEKIQAAYVTKFINASTGKIGPGTQTSQSIALYTGIVPNATRTRVVDYLVKDIQKQKSHLTTGILGTKFMLEILSREGHSDLAYDVVTQPDFPGWGWMLKNGATTLWEHWELSKNTYSHNHPMFGSVSQWMMQWLGGIQADQKSIGYDQIVIRPQTPSGLEWVNSSYNSVRGQIRSNWAKTGNTCTFEVVIPPNSRANIVLPAPSGSQIKADGKVLTKIKRLGPDSIEISTGSGHYTFTVRSDIDK